jgi:transcriptional regulator with XRE-family HTH domain
MLYVQYTEWPNKGELVDQLSKRLRNLRKSQKMSLRDLADKVGCSPSYLSMVENAKIDPSISRLKRIAEGLGTTIRGLFQDEARDNIVIRKADRQRADFPAAKLRIEMLVPQLPQKLMDARLAKIEPGGGSDGDYQHPGEEFGLVIKGSMELTIQGDKYQLAEGDSFYFPSPYNHSFRNTGDDEVIVVWVNCPPSW